MDSTLGRWGRNLINKRYPGCRLNNLDYLLGVSDLTRQGHRDRSAVKTLLSRLDA